MIARAVLVAHGLRGAILCNCGAALVRVEKKLFD
jgi:hypothetical protein